MNKKIVIFTCFVTVVLQYVNGTPLITKPTPPSLQSKTRTPIVPRIAKCPAPFYKVAGLEKCYLAIDDLQTWDTSNTDCIAKGGSLIKVESPEELTWLLQLFAYGDGIWIGASYDGSSYKWTDGTPFTNFPNCTSLTRIVSGSNIVVSNGDCVCGCQYNSIFGFRYVCKREPMYLY